MNRNELHGGARYVGGKVETAVGSAIDSREWKVDGVVDQVAGGAQHLYGRAQSIAGDVADVAREGAEDARERLSYAVDRAGEVARRGADRLDDVVVDRALPSLLAAGACGVLLGWLLSRLRA